MAWHGRARRGLRDRCDRQRSRARRQRGATGVEYALALALLVGGSIGAVQYLEDETADEVDAQADCISTRPPPTTCQPAAATPLDGTGGGVGGDPGGGTPGTTDVAAFEPTTVTAVRETDPIYDVAVDLTVLDDMSQPVEGELITAQVVFTQSSVPSRVGQSFYVYCVTDENGQCTIDFDSRFDDVTELSFKVVAVGSDAGYDFGVFNEILIGQPPPDTTVTGTG